MKNLSTIFFCMGVYCLSSICVSAQQKNMTLEKTLWQAIAPVCYTTKTNGAKSFDISSANSDSLKNQNKSDSSSNLKIGIYKIAATESSSSSFGTFKQDISFSIKIESIDANGNVKGRLYKGGGEGRVKGGVDAKGNLQLQGFYTDGLNNEWSFKLNATVEDDDTITDGKFQGANRYVTYKGTFNLGILDQ